MHKNVMRLVAALGLCAAVTALDNGLGRTPPLGFNTWNYFGCSIDESVLRTAADKLIALGLADAGYKYLNIDDCWQTRSRNSEGQLQADPYKFPSGMVALGEEIHSRGFKFGIYSDAGLFTCQGYPGSRLHEDDDAAIFASWGVDYLKYDNCFAASLDVKQRYTAMRDALNKTGRPIYFSMCEWGVNEPWKWAPDIGNSWRTDADIAATWDSILRSLDNGAAGLAKYAAPGGWNDPDMLEVGNGLLTRAQQRSHFALWALVKAPLLIGADLDRITNISLSILLAKEVIAINQDGLGVAGDIIWKEGPAEIWASPLEHNTRAVILFNRHHAGNPVDISVSWDQLGYKPTCETQETSNLKDNALSKPSFNPLSPAQWLMMVHKPKWLGVRPKPKIRPQCNQFRALVRDLYAEEDLGVFEGGYTANLENYDVAVLKVTPTVEPSSTPSNSERDGYRGIYDSDRVVNFWVHLAHDLQCRIRQWLGVYCSKCRRPQVLRVSRAEGSLPSAAAATWRPWHGRSAAALQERLRLEAHQADMAVGTDQPSVRQRRIATRSLAPSIVL